MRTVENINAVRVYLRGVRQEGKSVGFVPTMGALHEGHLALFRRAKDDCDLVVASIFVNPTQFGPNEDFGAYPRPLQRDLQMLSNAGVDAVFLPTPEEMYPAGFQTFIEVPEVAVPMEGTRRPGHFRGVATVVAKLLHIVQADNAYFGQKDYQQYMLIERMVRDLNIPVGITMVPTVRDTDGLALSSRNAYLSGEERQAAAILYKVIQRAEQRLTEGVTDPKKLLPELENLLASEPLANLDYLLLADPETLQPVIVMEESPVLLALAVHIGKTHLIDNALLTPNGVAQPRPRHSRA